jgi:hypothetical protein
MISRWKDLPVDIVHNILYQGSLDTRIRLKIPTRKLNKLQSALSALSALSIVNLKPQKSVRKELQNTHMAYRVFFKLDGGRRMVLFVNDIMACVNCFDRSGAFEYHWATAQLDNEPNSRLWFYYDRDAPYIPIVSYQTLMEDHEFTQEELEKIALESEKS